MEISQNKFGVEGLLNALDAQSGVARIAERHVEADPSKAASADMSEASRLRVEAKAITGLGQNLDVEV